MKIKHIIVLALISIMTSCKTDISRLSVEHKNNYKFNAEIIELLEKDSLNPDYQMSATNYATKGDYKNALLQWDLAINSKKENLNQTTKDSLLRKYNKVSAKEYIVKQSKNSSIVIINEAHHMSSHRVFTESLLQEMYNIGYKVICIEALGNGDYKDTHLNERKHLIQSSGFYTKNPQFGNMIRSALEIGYKVYPYETTQRAGGGIREADQANNVIQIIKENPNQKYLIYCGSGHALEGEVSFFGGRALAGRIHDSLGINPLTIDQVFYSEKSTVGKNNPYTNLFNIKKSSILLDKNQIPFSYRKNNRWIDIVVFHPITEYTNNRPNWLLKNDNKLVKVRTHNKEIQFPIIAKAYLENEDIDNAIPYDIIEIENKSDFGYLALKKGKYNILLVTKDGDVFKYEEYVK